MRDQGRLAQWDDKKGFGWVTPDQGGLRAFVHIRAFSYRHRRPREGDVITYQLTWDPKGRPRAENVLFREMPAPRPDPEPTNVASAVLLGTTFIGVVVALVVSGRAPWFAVPLYLVMSLLVFCVYAFDKSAAMNKRWRTKETTLQMLSLCGGWPGALLAQRMFHHKSKKADFQAVFLFIVVLHWGLAGAVFLGYVKFG